MSNFHALTIERLQRLTPNSIAVSLTIPEGLRSEFEFTPGQYITVKHQTDSGEIRRAYSISSAPNNASITIGIKKVSGGTFSVYANDELQEGMTLEVMPPEGRFIYERKTDASHIAAFAAGSGITPIMSIIRSVLQEEDASTAVLVYGNKDAGETMFLSDIEMLKEKYPDRFFVQYVYSRSREADSMFGRIERSTVNFIVKNKFADRDFDAFYLCGPEPMINTVSETLEDAGIEKDRVLFELFSTALPDESPAADLSGKTEVEVVVDDEHFNFSMDRNSLVLDAVLDQDIDAPYSCQGGVCSTCIARVKEGEVSMERNQILTDSEVAEGLILTCQAHPLGPVLKIDYDDV